MTQTSTAAETTAAWGVDETGQGWCTACDDDCMIACPVSGDVDDDGWCLDCDAHPDEPHNRVSCNVCEL